MKVSALFLTIVISIINYSNLYSQYHYGEEVYITERQKGDVYIGAEKISIENVIEGDLMAAGANISISDSVLSDLTCAGASIKLSGFVGDDVRCAGGTIDIKGIIGDDLILFGGDLNIDRETTVNGQLLAFGGDTRLNGHVKGKAKVLGAKLVLDGVIENGFEFEGEKIIINGTIKGDSKIAANEIEFGDRALIDGNLEYWSEEGEVVFRNNLVLGKATFNPELALETRPWQWSFSKPLFWLLPLFYVLASLLILLLLNLFFGKYFKIASHFVREDFSKSLGVGVLYLLGFPILIAILFAIVIGIPLAVLLLILYIFSLLFGHAIASVMLAQYINDKQQKHWKMGMITIISLGLFLVIKLVTIIPFLGWLWSIIIIGSVYGGMILSQRKLKKA
jgi:cytoskeletal protein CcmA (bactofilin family)